MIAWLGSRMIFGRTLKAWLPIVGAALLALVPVAAWFFGKREGRREAQADTLRGTLDRVKEGNDVENAVRRLGDGAVHDELRRDWSRPGN